MLCQRLKDSWSIINNLCKVLVKCLRRCQTAASFRITGAFPSNMEALRIFLNQINRHPLPLFGGFNQPHKDLVQDINWKTFHKTGEIGCPHYPVSVPQIQSPSQSKCLFYFCQQCKWQISHYLTEGLECKKPLIYLSWPAKLFHLILRQWKCVVFFLISTTTSS